MMIKMTVLQIIAFGISCLALGINVAVILEILIDKKRK